jgi:hypothetical protein
MDNKDNPKRSKRLFKLPEWLNRQTITLLIIATIFLSTLTLSEPLHITGKNPIMTLDGTTSSELNTPTPTLPLEWEENSNQTDGIIICGTILVLIVVGGTYSVLRQKS